MTILASMIILQCETGSRSIFVKNPLFKDAGKWRKGTRKYSERISHLKTRWEGQSEDSN